MVGRVDLYDSHYAHTEADTYRQIRLETYCEDLGQTSWITAEEVRRFLSWLDVQPGSEILEIACGSGGVSLLAASALGANVIGIDINEQAVQTARQKAERENISNAVSLQAQKEALSQPWELVEPVSERELEVLHLINDGLTNQKIADQVVIAVSTVKTHINHLYGKIRRAQRVEAVASARDLGLT